MNRPSFARVGALTGAGVLALSACATPGGSVDNPSPGAGTPTTFTVGLTYTPDIQFAPFYVAAEQGYYDDAGLDVTLRHHGASEGLFGAIESGREDVVVAGGDEMLQARSQGTPLLDVATLYQEYPVTAIVPDESDIRSAGDLAGRTVGVPGPFGETYFGLLALLDEAGLAEDDVRVEHIGYTQQAALTAGHVDAVMGFVNNDAVQFEAAGESVRTIPIAEGDAPLVGIGLGVLDETAEREPEAVAALVEATLRGVRDVIEDPEAAIEASSAHVPDLATEEQRAAARATLDATVPLYGRQEEVGAQDPRTWRAMAELMDAHGLLAGPVPGGEAWTDEFLPSRTN
ncbi:ABC transporter substrate-binding protein [Georgenia deserti]|uniref:ABC transporter substrate-binding protein n=1 Tax=Georgenia deserti TaxID=2093781 RepID=A0ABW4L3B1_9MICO